MDIDLKKFRRSLESIVRESDSELLQFLRLWPTLTIGAIDKALDLLAARLLDPTYTGIVRDTFPELLLLVVTKSFPIADDAPPSNHAVKCVALSKLVTKSQHIRKYAQQFFATSPAPFSIDQTTPTTTTTTPSAKRAKTRTQPAATTVVPIVTDLDIVRACHRLLECDTSYYRAQWDWSVFVQRFLHKGCSVQRLYCNEIVAIVLNMSAQQLQLLNGDVADVQAALVERSLLAAGENANGTVVGANVPRESDDAMETDSDAADASSLTPWPLDSDIVTSVQGVLLPIFNAANARYYQHAAEVPKSAGTQTVLVESTRTNLRNLAVGIASDKAVCLSGPVGCGKTSLVEYLAKRTGRMAMPWDVRDAVAGERSEDDVVVQMKRKSKGGKKRKNASKEVEEVQQEGEVKKGGLASGFLRIQLGDQTDSKMLLGQYRCTDVPGEFVWQAGALTQAVMHGYWLLLEDIDLATQDVTVALTNLLENNALSVPGLNDSLRIAPGFQLFVTLRNQKLSNCTQQSNLQMLNKYLYVVNMLPLRSSELCEMVNAMFPRFQTIDQGIVDRMVRVFLKFSRGDHNNADDDETNAEVATGETMAVDVQQQQQQPQSRIGNSNRLVSTRDLLKWCTRSNATFADTSQANRFLVLKNAVDLFCGYLPDAAKLPMIIEIGAELNISIGMCERFAAEHMPKVQVTSEEITVGRVQLSTHLVAPTMDAKRAPDNGNGAHGVQSAKKLKTAETTYVNVVQQNRLKAPTFSFTRPACCIMERIAVAVQQNEPVLLVGETGVGKTSSVQYLGFHTQHKLVVVNMNNQSDVSDLIGGFKPVDFAFVVSPLRTEFEALFKLTFNASKNEKFLGHVSVCFQRAEFVVLIKLMLRIVQTALAGAKTGEEESRTAMAMRDPRTRRRWHELNVKLLKLEAQLRKSMNISFAFIAGSLVKCIQNGDWVLLDEINLASAETLECLSTILEPDGSIVLLEKGDLVPVKRHPEFRIFACMNPSTDVGKKELPVGIRNRFTEFYVDELDKLSDLEILIRDYLVNTGIQAAKVHGIANLYRELRRGAQLELNDGLGNRPVYSLRTLCRALSICAKNLCGSVERNLYESFCMSFLTQLDAASHAKVLALIQEKMLTKARVKAVLAQPIPKPLGAEYIDFEGYWIQVGTRPLQACESYILTDSVRSNLKDLARIVSIGRLPVLLQGPTSAGKTSLIDFVARKSGNVCMRINNHEHTDLQEYIGTYTADASGKLAFREGVLVDAMRNGHWIILDELNLASSDILEALNRVLDDNRELFIAETQTLVRAHPNFMLFATQNPPGLYGGRKALSRAFKNRFIELHFADIPRAELEVILEKRCLIPKSYAVKMVKTMSELHANRKTAVNSSLSLRSTFTLRDLFRWGNRYTLADKALLEDGKYDWNQHLVDEGYLALSAKIRSDADVSIIEETLFRNFRKKIVLADLFELSDGTSMVTKGILDGIKKHPRFEQIVWTFNMRRMAVLAAKALQFNEPVLLVGSTGCGKTTLCQILADIAAVELKILNCHMHTEGGDFLGGLRPYRGGNDEDADAGKSGKLFEWANGPLVLSMQQGCYFLADEISLAEDSVLERLNCILEPERTVLLSEKGSGADEASDLIVTGADGFQFLATMNPGGDFGKKELSPALRNRFTEIWCRATDDREDLCRIAAHQLRRQFGVLADARTDTIVEDVAAIVVDSVFYMRDTFVKFNFSIRDVLAWIEYVTKHASLSAPAAARLSVPEALVFGMETMFLDALEMLPHDSVADVERWRRQALKHLLSLVHRRLQQWSTVKLSSVQAKKGTTVEWNDQRFGIEPFYLPRAENKPIAIEAGAPPSFVFSAPTTQRNLFCLLSALSLNKPILLEGPPGVGKTSLVEQVTAAIGYSIVRINLCEHTDLADLFGADLPATQEDNVAAPTDASEDNAVADRTAEALGSFVWRDGPLLAALKAPNTWILLDELNLAPQSVLEGLNAVLDHRGEVYIPELNKTFKLGPATRIFASQNPLKQGGGRKGLPQSFLNRFTKVYLRKLQSVDLRHVVQQKYAGFFDECREYVGAKKESTAGGAFDLCNSMVAFTESLDAGIAAFEFGYKGGPFEVNLRDILRWCEFLCNPQAGIVIATTLTVAEFQRTVYEKMKLVYYQRMRAPADKAYIRAAFERTFGWDAERLELGTRDISLYWTDGAVYLDDVRCAAEVVTRGGNDGQRPEADVKARANASSVPLLLVSQREVLKNMAECMMMLKPVVLCGPTDCGKTKIIDVLCTLINRACVMDTIDDSVTGSFQQIDLNRHLDETAVNIEALLTTRLQYYALSGNTAANTAGLVRLLAAWESYTRLAHNASDDNDSDASNQSTAASADLLFFKKRLQRLDAAFTAIQATAGRRPTAQQHSDYVRQIRTKLDDLAAIVQLAGSTLNSGGHFEWVDSKIVQAFRFGRIICLEHVNLCSSAILDRLNPLFEADGTLLLSEKGVTADAEPEIIRKHAQFNAFLTLDPKNGEISRAMRNRCIELHIQREEYTDDDLRQLVYAAGVREMPLIRAVLDIHRRCRAVSEFSTLGVSSVTKCADLVVRNRLLGCSAADALARSAIEVYVRSAGIDLTGFGMAFYRGQLRQAIGDVVEGLDDGAEDAFDFGNVIDRADDLTAFSMVRKQCEVFLTCVRSLCRRADEQTPDDMRDKLRGLFDDFEKTEEKENVGIDVLLCKLLLTVIYECASPVDIQQRRVYLQASLEQIDSAGHPLLVAMLELNERLAADLSANNVIAGQAQPDLPWNRRILPRLVRHYGDEWQPENQLRCSVLLMARAFLDDIVPAGVGVKLKLSQMDALSFSLAVREKSLQNVPNNELVQHLYAYLTQLKPFLEAALANAGWTMTDEEAVELCCSMLWQNRLYACSQRKLFANKSVDEVLVNLLARHIKWLDKNFIAKLPAPIDSTPFTKTRSIMANIVQSSLHPLHRLRKLFVKQMTNFRPYFDDQQIAVHRHTANVQRNTRLTPVYGAAYDTSVVRQRLAALEDVHVAALKIRLAALQSAGDLSPQLICQPMSTSTSTDGSDSLAQNVIAFVHQMQTIDGDATATLSAIDLDDNIVYFEELLTHEDPATDRFVAELLPLREYFALKSLNIVLQSRSEQRPLNRQYFEAIQSLGVAELRLLHNIRSPAFAACEQLWHAVWQSANDNVDADKTLAVSVQQVAARLPVDFYRNYASFRRSLDAALQEFALRSLATRRRGVESLWSGPVFTSTAMEALVDASGATKSCGLVELESWKGGLQQLGQLLWHNVDVFQRDFGFEHANILSSFSRSQQLLTELETVFDAFHRKPEAENPDGGFLADFQRLITILTELNTSAKIEITTDPSTPSQRSATVRLASAINTITGAIELNLLTHLPLLDPVEKNRLKKLYNADEQSHLLQLLAAYECMQITMNYRDLAREPLEPVRRKLAALREQTHTQIVALRPPDCAYGQLLRDVNHFLHTCCQPRALLDLYAAVEAHLSAEASAADNGRLEAIKRIDLWISNSCQFVHHTLVKYEPFYMDFLVPIRNSITMLTHGWQGLKQSLLSMGVCATPAEQNAVDRMLGNLVEYPSVEGLQILAHGGAEEGGCHVGRVLAKSDRFDAQYLRLLKVKLREIENNITLTGTISASNVHGLNHLLSLFNGVWQKQEEIRQNRKAEDESLYVTKTRCAEEDDDEVASREVRSMFPNTIDDDFGDFIDAVSLEQKPENKTLRTSSKIPDLLQNADISDICQIFANIMGRFARSYYCHPRRSSAALTIGSGSQYDYVHDYREKFGVFAELFPKFETGLTGSIDDRSYGGLSLLVGASMQDVDMLRLNDVQKVAYDFYKDSNIAEVVTSAEVLKKIAIRANTELELYPEHAGLLDILSIIKRIQSFPTTSPIVRFSSGFQILNKKLNEWNKLAHRGNTMMDLEIEVGGYIQRWMKLELQCWRECLSQSFAKCQAKAHRYWFFIYNLVQEFLSTGDRRNVLHCDLTDFRAVEKSFDLEDTTTTGLEPSRPANDGERLKTADVAKVLKQFVESANFADFAVRMGILQSFEQYLHHVPAAEPSLRKRKNKLITIMHNLHLYFTQFAADIEARVKGSRTVVEKKLKDFVKMESYSKYLSYFSQDANVAQVHRKLHKLLKEFELQVGEKIGTVFMLKDSQMVQSNGKSHETDGQLHIVDVGVYVCAASRKVSEATLAAMKEDDSMGDALVLLPKADKLFATARNIVKHAVLHSQYPSLIYNMNTLLGDNIESLTYLRRLEVDRTKERPHQKMQAKQILQQKRKALADFYKTMTRLGFSYRAGLMETKLTDELVDLRIVPFCVPTMVLNDGEPAATRRIRANVLALGADLDGYFAKAVYKLKLLQTVLLQPHVDVGGQHLERIRGFAVDMFLLVQQQRRELGGFVLQLNDLRRHVRHVKELERAVGSDVEVQSDTDRVVTFERLRRKYAQMHTDMAAVADVMQQYQLLFKCVPVAGKTIANRVLDAPLPIDAAKYAEIRRRCEDVQRRALGLLNQLALDEYASMFYSGAQIEGYDGQFAEVCKELDALLECFVLDADNSTLHARAAMELRERLQQSAALQASSEESDDCKVDDEFANTNLEIENIIHTMLFAMQTIYKKHSDHVLETQALVATEQESTAADRPTDDDATEKEDDPIELNHLKIRIAQQLHGDLQLLNVGKIASKLDNVLLTVQLSADPRARRAAALKCSAVLPILEQFEQLCLFYLVQQMGAHRVAGRMLSILMTVFVELGAKGFCVPPDLMTDEEGDAGENKEEKGSEGFGLEDGTGEKDVSDKLESEDQLDTAKKPGDDKETDDKEDADCKEEKGIDMSEDFDSKLQDLEKKEPNSDDDSDEEDDKDADKEMGETEDGAEKLDDQIWGSDEEKEEEEEDQDMNEEDDGKGSKDEKDEHNDLANKNNETTQGDDEEQQEGLDAADNEQQEKKKKEKDIDHLDEPDVGEDQANPHHNDLEEPPEPEDLDLGELGDMDKDDGKENDERHDDNPFDIDTMKEQMEVDEDENEAEDGENGDDDKDEEADAAEDANKDGEEGDSSDDENEDGDTKKDETTDEQPPADEEQEEQPTEEETDSKCPAPADEIEEQPAEEKEEEEHPPATKEDDEFKRSNDKSSKEDNVQSMPEEERTNPASKDQVQNQTKSDDRQQQQDDMDDQDTGEDDKAVGQAENEESKSGHHGIADTKETKSADKEPQTKDTQEKRKQGNTDEERSLGDPDQREKRQLKTVDKLNQAKDKEEEKAGDEKEEPTDEAEEYQHVKEARKNDKTTLDNATEEQSKRNKHEDEADDKDEDKNAEDEEAADDQLLQDDEEQPADDADVDEMRADETDVKSDKPSTKKDRQQKDAQTEDTETVEVEGEYVDTLTVQRSTDSSAHCAMDLVQDKEAAAEPTALETIDMRRMFEQERQATRLSMALPADFESWNAIANKMLPSARELCEQLRLILEPTKCTRLKGDYRTGRRINLKKIIPYIASQFRKDKIWLRRTKPAQRDYRITVAVDDSKSMDNNKSRVLTLEAISLLSQALTLLESGRLSILSYGEKPKIILDYAEQFDGPRLCSALKFDQNQSRIAELLQFARVAGAEEGGGGDNGLFENLLLILGDGQNVYSEGEKVVRDAVKLARMQRIFIVFIIIDNPENKKSILDGRVPIFSADGKSITSFKSSLDLFPFPYYVIVRDLAQLPLVLSDAMRQWFELVNSEQ